MMVMPGVGSLPSSPSAGPAAGKPAAGPSGAFTASLDAALRSVAVQAAKREDKPSHPVAAIGLAYGQDAKPTAILTGLAHVAASAGPTAAVTGLVHGAGHLALAAAGTGSVRTLARVPGAGVGAAAAQNEPVQSGKGAEAKAPAPAPAPAALPGLQNASAKDALQSAHDVQAAADPAAAQTAAHLAKARAVLPAQVEKSLAAQAQPTRVAVTVPAAGDPASGTAPVPAELPPAVARALSAQGASAHGAPAKAAGAAVPAEMARVVAATTHLGPGTKAAAPAEPGAGMRTNHGETHRTASTLPQDALAGPGPSNAQTGMPQQTAGLSQEVSVQIAQAAQTEASHLQAGGTSLVRISLNPPELGQVSVTLRAGQTGLSAVLYAEEPAAAAILQLGQGELQQRLAGLGFSRARVEVTLSGRPEGVQAARRSSAGRRN